MLNDLHGENTDRIDLSHIDNMNFDEEISPVKIFEPRSAGIQKNAFLQFATSAFNTDNDRHNLNDFAMKKNLLAFKDF